MMPKELTELAFHPVAYHRRADGLADSEPEASELLPTLIGIHRKIFCPQAFTVTVAARVFGLGAETLVFAQTLVHRASYS
jgi:hypothetical protein